MYKTTEGDFYCLENYVMKIALVGVVLKLFAIYGVRVCLNVIQINILSLPSTSKSILAFWTNVTQSQNL